MQRLAFGQDSPPARVPDATKEEGASPDAASDLAAQVARQQAEIAALREEVEHRLQEEKAAREAAQAKANQAMAKAAQEAKEAKDAKDEAEAVVARNPRVSGSDGLTLSGFMQNDYYAKQTSEDQLNTATGAPLNDNRFAIRRARLRTSIDRQYLAAVMEADFNTTNGPQMRPMAMEATVKLPGPSVPYVAATVGIFKIPFGYEVGQADYQRLFAERSNMERAFFPGEYDLGARIGGGWRFVRYVLAVQNGEPLGEGTFPGRDPNGAKDVIGRLGVASPLADRVFLQAGCSGLTGKGLHKGTSPTKPTTIWQDRNENGRLDTGELIVSPGTSGLPSMNFSRYALGADLLLSVETAPLGTTTAYAEIEWAKNLDRGLLPADPYGSLGRDLREMGYYLALVQDLGKYLQAGVRYDHYDPDRDSTDRVAGTFLLSSQAVSTVALALAVRLKIGGLANRLLAQYDINRNHAGRDQAGLPVNLASNVFTLRAEAVF